VAQRPLDLAVGRVGAREAHVLADAGREDVRVLARDRDRATDVLLTERHDERRLEIDGGHPRHDGQRGDRREHDLGHVAGEGALERVDAPGRRPRRSRPTASRPPRWAGCAGGVRRARDAARRARSRPRGAPRPPSPTRARRVRRRPVRVRRGRCAGRPARPRRTREPRSGPAVSPAPGRRRPWPRRARCPPPAGVARTACGGRGTGRERALPSGPSRDGRPERASSGAARQGRRPEGEHRAVTHALVALHLPAAGSGEEAMHGQPSGIQAQRRGLRIDDDLSSSHREAPVRDPVGPGVQQRGPHRRALGEVGVQSPPLPEQLLAAVTQRAADHPGVGDEGRLDAAAGARRQRQGAQSFVQGAFADHPSSASMVTVSPGTGPEWVHLREDHPVRGMHRSPSVLESG
jgi:hypothetical protein